MSSSSKMQAIMNVSEGEEIAGMWVTPHIAGTGIYKLLAKRNKEGKFEWAHFVQRDNGNKDSVYRGTVDTKEQLEQVCSIINSNLQKTFGSQIKLQIAQYDSYIVGGGKLDNTVN